MEIKDNPVEINIISIRIKQRKKSFTESHSDSEY